MMQLWESTLSHASSVVPQLLDFFPYLVAILERSFDHLEVSWSFAGYSTGPYTYVFLFHVVFICFLSLEFLLAWKVFVIAPIVFTIPYWLIRFCWFILISCIKSYLSQNHSLKISSSIFIFSVFLSLKFLHAPSPQ